VGTQKPRCVSANCPHAGSNVVALVIERVKQANAIPEAGGGANGTLMFDFI
jgi:hypothetical protein